MGKSTDFVKYRIDNGLADIFFNEDSKFLERKFNEYLNAYFHAPAPNNYFTNEFINLVKKVNKNEWNITYTAKTDDGIIGDISVFVKYDENAEFEYFTMERCVCDGTLLFLYEQGAIIINKIFTLSTFNKEKITNDYENNPFNYDFYYTVGNFVVCDEHGDFGTKEKPWMRSRFTTMLPIKFDIKKKG